MTTELKFKKDNKGNITDAIITGATLYYTNIRRPRPIYDDRKVAYDKARKEYSVEVAVTEDVADQWDEVFTKQPSKKYTNAKFIEKYKLEDKSELPFPDEKKQFTIKIVQKVNKNDGEPISDFMIPRVFVIEDKKAVDITFEKNVGNGSTGAVKVRVNGNDYGTFAYLGRVKIDSLIEYEDSDGGVSEDDKDFLGVDEVELAEAPKRTASKATAPRDDDDDGDDGDDSDGADPDDF